MFLSNAGDGSGRLFILEKPGRIRIVKNGALLSQPFLDISSIVKSTNSEQGLLGLAFHPSYASNGYFYVTYTAPRPGDSVGSILTLARYTVSTNPDVASSASGSVLLTIEHPSQGNHNGGMLAFGPDSYLYWSTGDGGSGGDPPNNAQNLGVLLGKLLRLDVDSASPYAAPSSNPFFSSPNANTKLIWAYGLRNSWRYSFDRLTGDVYVGDVGQSAWEEIDFQPAGDPGGENYGWRLMEGFHCYNPSTNCDPLNVTTLPVTEYGHNPECAVTGGYVYRGSHFPSLYGRYFYGDYCSGKVWSLHYDGGWTVEQLVDTPYSISSFGQDEDGDLYLVDLGGSVYRIVYQGPVVSVSLSDSLMGNDELASGQTHSQSYLGRLNGPVKVKDENGDSIFTSQVVLSGPGNSFNETMGYPIDQFTTDYWFPYYDHGYPTAGGDNVRTWILVGNPSASVTANVNIYIGGQLQPGSPFSIPAGDRVTPRWIGTIGGPVHVSSNIPVFASERVFTVPDDSFSEMMGYPANQFTTEYWFPWYDSINMDTSIKVGNTSSSQTANVDIYIGAVKEGSYSIPHDQTISKSYASTLTGPVRVVSTNSVNIVASQWTLSGSSNSFNEVMGSPFDQFTTEYWFPWYDHGYPSVGGDNVRTWILVGNPSASLTATAHIYIGGVEQPGSPFSIPAGTNVQPRWIGTIGGPVHVVSDIPVFTSERVFTVPEDSFNEVMGYPADQLTSEYWFPWYDSINMNNRILVSRP